MDSLAVSAVASPDLRCSFLVSMSPLAMILRGNMPPLLYVFEAQHGFSIARGISANLSARRAS